MKDLGISKHSHLTRQMDLIPLTILDTQINIIGAGAIGSFTTLALAKMGFHNITVFDYDTIDVENMNCQFYRFKDIGKQKVLALQELVEDFTNVKITAINDAWSGTILDDIVICAVDSMKARQLVFDSHARKAFNTKCIIDPRMGAEMALQYVYNPLSPKELGSYSKTLYSDSEALSEPCTSRSTAYTALMLSGLIAKTVKSLLCGQPVLKNVMWDIKNDDFMALKRE